MDEICLSGGTGFVGRHVRDRLRRGGAHVRVLTRRNGVDDRDAIHGDLLAPDSLRTFVLPGSIVVHSAFARGIDNVVAARHLADVSLAASASLFVHVSTAAVVGRTNDTMVDEETPAEPLNDYEREKLAIEQTLVERMRGRVPLRILRPTAVFGDGGMNLVSLAQHLISSSRRAIAAKMALMGRRQMNLVAVENVSEAIAHLIRSDRVEDGAPYIVCDDHAANDYVHVAQCLMEGLGMKPARAPFDVSFALGALLKLMGRSITNPHTRFSAARLRATGYRPVVDFDEAIRRFGRAYGQART